MVLTGVLSTLSPPPPSPTQKILTHVYINAEIHFIYLQMHNEAQKQVYYPFCNYKISPPYRPNTMLKDQRDCALTVSTLSVGWG